jgi:hypothetical protein
MPYAKEKSPQFYRRLADQCRQAARTASTEEERADLLTRAKTWEFLAEHPRAASFGHSIDRLAHWR